MCALLALVIWATPPPPVFASWVEMDLRYGDARLEIEGLRRTRVDPPRAHRRYRGRFEARLEGGGKVLDASLFDVPLLHDAESIDDMTEDAKKLGERMRAGVRARFRLSIPYSAGATKVVIYDTKLKRVATEAALPTSETKAEAKPAPASSRPARSTPDAGAGALRAP